MAGLDQKGTGRLDTVVAELGLHGPLELERDPVVVVGVVVGEVYAEGRDQTLFITGDGQVDEGVVDAVVVNIVGGNRTGRVVGHGAHSGAGPVGVIAGPALDRECRLAPAIGGTGRLGDTVGPVGGIEHGAGSAFEPALGVQVDRNVAGAELGAPGQAVVRVGGGDGSAVGAQAR